MPQPCRPSSPPPRRRAAAVLVVVAVLGACGRRAPVPVPTPASPAPPQAPLPTGLGPLAFPVPGGGVVGGFGWAERAGNPVFVPYLTIRPEAQGLRAVAIAAGLVAGIHEDPARLGLYALVTHAAGWSSLYGGCGAMLVSVGEAVSRGAAVCTLPAGLSTAVFGLLLDGQPVNPGPYLDPA